MLRGVATHPLPVVRIVIPIFDLKVERLVRYTAPMGKESMIIVLALVFLLGAGIGLYAARLVF